MAVALPLILGLATYVGIHFLEPRLAITWSYAHLHRYTLLPWLGVIRGTNAAFSAVALLALAGAARRLGQSRREAAAITLLAWSAFGILQLVMGYTDIYPFPLAVTAVYCWLALGVIAGEVHP